MKKRQKEVEKAYEEQWDGGRGSHHPDYDPEAVSVWRAACTDTVLRKGSLGTPACEAVKGGGALQVAGAEAEENGHEGNHPDRLSRNGCEGLLLLLLPLNRQS